MRFHSRTLLLYILMAICAITFGWYMYIATNKTRLFVNLPLKQQQSISHDPFTSNGLIRLNQSQSTDKVLTTTGHPLDEFERIDCSINQQYVIDCILQSGTQNAFIPFSFVRSYFDIYGQLRTNFDGRPYLQFQHSYSKVFTPQERYDHRSGFLWFDSYNVEIRERVIRLSGEFGVPLSNQWSQNTGHLYPVQICQFGLSHFSKQLQDSKLFVLQLEDGTFDQRLWKRWTPKSLVTENAKLLFQSKNLVESVQILVGGKLEQVLHLNTSIGKEKGSKEEVVAFQLKLRKKSPFYRNLMLTMRYKAIGPFRMQVFVQNDDGQVLNVTYTNDEKYISNISKTKEPNEIYYIGNCSEWTQFGRDLGVDVLKSLSSSRRRIVFGTTKTKTMLRIARIHFTGQLYVDNVTLNSNLHQIHSDNAVRWLLDSQDHNGGWPVQVERSLLKGRLRLKAGWYSAMAQGQAMSLLVRKHLFTQEQNDTRFLDAAVRAMNLFRKNSSDGGVRSWFDNLHVWYEEYPTQPSLFVLNGFIYSLFGLFDLKSTLEDQIQSLDKDSTNTWTPALDQASQLFDDGLKSLFRLLPLFDTGSGTLYDLRHFGLDVAPNLARWDYHTTHINQLVYLNTILNRESLVKITNRWMGYMQGKRSPHN